MSTNTGSFLTFLLACLIWIKIRLLKQNLNSFISTKKKKKAFNGISQNSLRNISAERDDAP